MCATPWPLATSLLPGPMVQAIRSSRALESYGRSPLPESASVRVDGNLWRNRTERFTLHGLMFSTLDLNLGFLFTYSNALRILSKTKENPLPTHYEWCLHFRLHFKNIKLAEKTCWHLWNNYLTYLTTSYQNFSLTTSGFRTASSITSRNSPLLLG